MTSQGQSSVVWSAAFLVLVAAGAGAQTPLALRLTVEDAQARALAASHRLAEARAREAAARSVVLSREAADRPTITGSGGYTRTNHVIPFTVPGSTGVPVVIYPDVPSNYLARVNLQWPIYSGGRTDALERAARADADATAAELAMAQADLRLEVARAYWAVVTARATVVVLEQGVARARAHVADVRERFDAGLVPPNEIASAEAQESRARMLLIEAQNQRDVSLADLARLTGLDPSQPVEPAAELKGSGDVLSVETLVESARASRDERRAMLLRIDAADEQRQAAAAGRRPTVGVVGGFDYARPNPRIFPRTDEWQRWWELGINVNWVFWDGGRTAADVATLTSLASVARHRLAEFDSVLSVEVRQRTLEIESGRAAVAAAEDAIRAATEARRVVTERYRVGVATQTEVLDAELALLQSELDRTRALAGVRLAEARLARAVGR